MGILDGPGDTIRPRLDAHKANVDRVHHIEGPKDADGRLHFLSLSEHLAIIDEWLSANPEVKLFIIDPLSAFYGGKTDSHRDASIRAVLGPVAALADKHHVAIVGIAHLNKSQGKSINRVGGSIGIVAAARSAWLVAADPEDSDEQRRLFVKLKNNLGTADTGLAYCIDDGRLAWESDPVLISADDITAEGDGSPIDEAREWLASKLEFGHVAARKVLKDAKSDGIAEKTLRRAQKELGVIAFQQGKAWHWRRADDTTSEPAPVEGEGILVI